MIDSLASWIGNVVLMAILAAKADEKRGYQIEDHPVLGIFLVLVIPTLVELASQYLTGKPFLVWLLGF